MKGKRNCFLCGGEGTYKESGDAHRSGGIVPCRHDPDLKSFPLKKSAKKASVSYEKITIPSDVNPSKPAEWQMVLRVDEAMKVNEDYNTLTEDNARMRKALNRIVALSKDPDMIRVAINGLNLK